MNIYRINRIFTYVVFWIFQRASSLKNNTFLYFGLILRKTFSININSNMQYWEMLSKYIRKNKYSVNRIL